MPELTVLHGYWTIQLTCGLNSLIDLDDVLRVGLFTWYALPSHKMVYARRHERTRNCKSMGLSLHRAVMNAPEGMEVDHINGDGTDNRKANLRIVTHLQNGRNRRKYFKKKSQSKYKGVRPYYSRWIARISVNRKGIYLGCFPTEEGAARAYDAAARKHHGEFAKTNADMLGDY